MPTGKSIAVIAVIAAAVAFGVIYATNKSDKVAKIAGKG